MGGYNTPDTVDYVGHEIKVGFGLVQKCRPRLFQRSSSKALYWSGPSVLLSFFSPTSGTPCYFFVSPTEL